MRGRRVGVLADGGGHAGIATSLLQRAGLELPRLGDALAAELRAGLPPTAAVSNPIDLAGGGEQDIRTFDRTAGRCCAQARSTRVLMTGYFGGYSEYAETLGRGEASAAEALADAARVSGRPLVVQTMHPQTAGVGDAAPARRPGLPLDRARRRGVRPAGRPRRARARRRPARCRPRRRRWSATATTTPARCSPPAACRSPARAPWPAADEAVAAADALGYPVVLKALGLLHKSDAGGVALGLRDEAALRAALADMERRLAPPAFTVEQHGARGRRRRAADRRALGRALRPDRAGRARRPVHRDPARRRGRAGPGRRGARAGPARLAARRAAAARGAWAAAARRRRSRGGARGAVVGRRRAPGDRRDRGQPAAGPGRGRPRARRATRARAGPRRGTNRWARRGARLHDRARPRSDGS